MELRRARATGCARRTARRSVHDLLFDDAHWTARWLVVDTAWLFGRRVLSRRVRWAIPMGRARIPVTLTQDRSRTPPTSTRTVRQSPARNRSVPLLRLRPVLDDDGQCADRRGRRCHAAAAHADRTPGADAASEEEAIRAAGAHFINEGDPHLRSAREVTGYHIRAPTIRSAASPIPDRRACWVIRYLVVDTGDWLSGRKVLIAPPWSARSAGQRRSPGDR